MGQVSGLSEWCGGIVERAFGWQPLTGSLTDLLVQVVLAGFRRRFLCQANGAL